MEEFEDWNKNVLTWHEIINNMRHIFSFIFHTALAVKLIGLTGVWGAIFLASLAFIKWGYRNLF